MWSSPLAFPLCSLEIPVINRLWILSMYSWTVIYCFDFKTDKIKVNELDNQIQVSNGFLFTEIFQLGFKFINYLFKLFQSLFNLCWISRRNMTMNYLVEFMEIFFFGFFRSMSRFELIYTNS